MRLSFSLSRHLGAARLLLATMLVAALAASCGAPGGGSGGPMPGITGSTGTVKVALLLPITASGVEWYRQGTDSVPAVSASASRDRSGVVHVTLANLDPTRAHDVAIELSGANASRATGRILTATAMNSHNTFEQPEAVKPAPFTGARVAGNQLSVALPAHSVVVVELR
jgi:alpha-L-arabinofuranosidase